MQDQVFMVQIFTTDRSSISMYISTHTRLFKMLIKMLYDSQVQEGSRRLMKIQEDPRISKMVQKVSKWIKTNVILRGQWKGRLPSD